MLPINIKNWSEAHIFYNSWLDKLTSKDDIFLDLENSRREHITRETPNGKLFTDNKFFKQLQEKDFFLAHITPNIHNILKDNLIYPSGGCLVGSVYCVPANKDGERFYLHNLGSYIYKKEIPRITNIKPQILLVKVTFSESCCNRLIGVDYLHLGGIHFDLYKELEYLLSNKERYNIEKHCIETIQRLLPLLSFVQNKFLNKSGEIDLFFKLFYEQIGRNPVLAYMLFETFCEFVTLYQNNKRADKWAKKGEIYTWDFKDSVFELGERSYFDLRSFHPSLEKIFEYLKNKESIKSLNYNELKKFFFDKLTILLFTKFWNKIIIDDWRTLTLDFKNLDIYFGPLLGHIIHRELRNFGRYPNFYYYFDQLKALSIWNYWNYLNIAIPFNGLIPKGEIGINPAFPNLKTEVYKTEIIQSDDDDLYLILKDKVKIDFVPRLVDLRFTILRNKDHEQRCNNI